MVKEFKNLQMAIFIRESTWMGNLMDMENITGQMVVILKDHLKMDWERVKEFGRRTQGTVTDTKVIMNVTKNLVLELLHGHLEMYIKETTKKKSEMDMDKCFGTMVLITKGNGKMGSNMVKEKFTFLVKE